MDIIQLIKDAAGLGLACGVIAMAAAMIYLAGRELLRPEVVVQAAVPKLPFGFCPPS